MPYSVIVLEKSFFKTSQKEQEKLTRRVFKTIGVNLAAQQKKPLRLLLAGQLVKDIMELDAEKFADFTATEILPHYSVICLMKVYNPDFYDNVLTYFGQTIAENSQELQAGQQFMMLAIECVYVWARKNIKNNAFKQLYLDLKSQNLQFPNSFQFFNKEEYQEYIEGEKPISYSSQNIENNNLQNSQQNKLKANDVMNESQRISTQFGTFWQQMQQTISASSRSSSNSIKAALEAMEPELDAKIKDIQGEIDRLFTVISPGKGIEEALDQAFDYQQKFQTFKDALKDAQQGNILWTDISVMLSVGEIQKENTTPNPIQQQTLNKNESQQGKIVSSLNKEAKSSENSKIQGGLDRAEGQQVGEQKVHEHKNVENARQEQSVEEQKQSVEKQKRLEELKNIEEQSRIQKQIKEEQDRMQEKIRMEQERKRMEDLAKAEEERIKEEQRRIAIQIEEERQAEEEERYAELNRKAQEEIRRQQEQAEQLRKQEELKKIEQLRIIEETSKAEEDFKKAEEARKIAEEQQARKDEENARRILQSKLLSQQVGQKVKESGQGMIIIQPVDGDGDCNDLQDSRHNSERLSNQNNNNNNIQALNQNNHDNNVVFTGIQQPQLDSHYSSDIRGEGDNQVNKLQDKYGNVTAAASSKDDYMIVQQLLKSNGHAQLEKKSHLGLEYQQPEAEEDDYSENENKEQVQELEFKSFNNDTWLSKLHGSSVQRLKSSSVFAKTINQNIDKYYQPYASSFSKIGSSLSYESQGFHERKKPQFSEREKLKEALNEKESLSQQVEKLQNNVQALQSAEKNKKLAVLLNMNEQCEDKITEQSKEIQKLKKQLAEEQVKKDKIQAEELQSLRVQLSLLQSQLAEQRSTTKSEETKNYTNILSDVEKLPQFLELQRQNEELKSRLSSHARSTLDQNQLLLWDNNTEEEVQQSKSNKMKRAQSPKIFANSNQNAQRMPAAPQNYINLQQQQLSQQTPFLITQKQHESSIQNTPQKEQRSYIPILPASASRNDNIQNRNGNYLNGMISPEKLTANQNLQFTSPSAGEFTGNLSDKQAVVGSGKRQTFEGEMKDMSNHSIIYNDKREEIESIHQNNQSMHSYNDSVKEILNPLQTKQNAASNENNQYNNNVPSLNAISNKNNNNNNDNQIANSASIQNFSNMKEGEQVEFNKSLFGLVTQFVGKLNRFKGSCLKSKYPIYEDSSVQIGVVTSHLLSQVRDKKMGVNENYMQTTCRTWHVISDKNSNQQIILIPLFASTSQSGDYFRVQLYYTNKGTKLLKNLKLTILDDQKDLQMQVSPEIIAELEPKGQKKQEVIITYKNLLASPCFVSFNFSGAAPVYIGLPTVVTKTLVFKDTDRESFKTEFKSRQYMKYILVPECNQKFAKTHQDFKVYIEKLIDLNPEKEFDHIQETSNYKMGVRFQFQHDQANNPNNENDLLLKVVCNPKHSALLYIAYNNPELTEKVTLVLNHFCFFFSSNKEA